MVLQHDGVHQPDEGHLHGDDRFQGQLDRLERLGQMGQLGLDRVVERSPLH